MSNLGAMIDRLTTPAGPHLGAIQTQHGVGAAQQSLGQFPQQPYTARGVGDMLFFGAVAWVGAQVASWAWGKIGLGAKRKVRAARAPDEDAEEDEFEDDGFGEDQGEPGESEEE